MRRKATPQHVPARFPAFGIALFAFVCCAVSVSHANTIIKLNLGGVGPDVGLNGAGIFATVNDGVAGTTGDQNTAVEYTNGLEFIPDITSNTASFTMSNVAEVGPATVIGSLVIQNFVGGSFNLYDSGNTLLLSGPLTNSALSGTIGPPGTGALFTTTLSTVTGGTLAPNIMPGTVSLSMDLTNVNGGAGFTVAGGGPQLNPFLADASLNIAADVVPEPATSSLLLIGVATALRRRG